MPNYCNYELHAYGKKKDLQTLYDWLRADYHYFEDGSSKIEVVDSLNSTPRPVEHHIGYRVFEAITEFFEDEEIKKASPEQDGLCAYITGYCAWSIYACMLETGKDGIGVPYLDCFKDDKNSKAISIVEASKILNLDIEIYSDECGNCFTEHYLIKHGNLEENEEGRYYVMFVEDYQDYEDFIKNLKGMDGLSENKLREIFPKSKFDECKANGETLEYNEFATHNCDYSWKIV